MISMKMITSYLLLSITTYWTAFGQQQPLGIFQDQTDIGYKVKRGSAKYNVRRQQYELTGAGYNIWNNHDEFHYVWKRLKGDFILQVRAMFPGKGVEDHRKFGWMVRSTLDTNSSHVSATVHGDGLAALQFRKMTNAATEEVRSAISAPDVIQLEKKGNKFTMSVAHFGEPFSTSEIIDIDLGEEVFAGLFVCSHNKDVLEKASFTNVRIVIPAGETLVPYRQYLGSNLEIMDIPGGNRLVIDTSTKSLQAPNWTKDGKALIYNREGLIYRFDLKNRVTKVVNTDFVKNNNNDHVISFDGKMVGLSSASSDPKSGSIIYTVPITGGKPKQITLTGPSYLHGWSPDGKWLTFTGSRNNEFDIYKIPSSGGEEIRLTTAKGLDDGSEYSPDGKFIYFNSNRTGSMQIWRMRPDGSGQEQLTFGELNDWFPHISPDGKRIVFISFMKEVPAGDHPFYKHVYLRMMPANGGKPTIIAYLYGGQGSINTPSWSPDSKEIAFISNTDFK